MSLKFFGFGGVVLSGTYTGTYTLAGTPTLSGTFAGTPTFSGAITFSAAGAAITLSSGTGAIALGTTPATTGQIRVPNNVTIMSGRNAGNTADVDILLLNASNVVRLGPGTISVQISGGGGSVGLYGTAPVAQAASIAAPTGGATVDAEARTAINSIRTAIGATSGIGITA